MNDFIGFVFLGVILFVSFVLYMVPTIVASIRKVPNVGGVAVVNLLTGWSLIGWVAALVMACLAVPVTRER